MPNQPDDRADEFPTTTPPWEVVAVFDPDGTGGDFGYTVGLASLGHPELHMWARPTDGEDPGADFKLSPMDIAAGLNRYAEAMLDGEFDIGDQAEVEFDEGLTRATFTFGEPVTPDSLDAFAVDPDSLVVPLRWQLDREPAGESRPVTTEVAGSIEARCGDWREIVRDLGGPGSGPGVDTDHRQHFGPWTAVIESVRCCIELVGARGRLSACIDHVEADNAEVSLAMGVASALARRHGRSGAFEAAVAAGRQDGLVNVDADDEVVIDLADIGTSEILSLLRHRVGDILAACYGLLVVGDLIDDSRASLVHDPLMSLCESETVRPWRWPR